MQLPATIAAEAAQTRQNVALSSIKHNAEQGEAVAKILEDAVRSAPVSSTRGTNINFSA